MKTIEELKACPRAYVTPQEIGPLLNMHPQTINLMAKNDEFVVKCLRSGNRTKIPRLPLMEWLGVKAEE